MVFDDFEACIASYTNFTKIKLVLTACFMCRYDGYEEGLWLHCVQYSGPGWVYECPLPDWAILS